MPEQESKIPANEDVQETSTEEPIRQRPGGRRGRKKEELSEEVLQTQAVLAVASALFAIAWIVSYFWGAWMFLPLSLGVGCCMLVWNDIVKIVRSSLLIIVAAVLLFQSLGRIPDALSGKDKDDQPDKRNSQVVLHEEQSHV